MTTTTRPQVTRHAFDRWHERFGGDIWPAFERALPFGGQLGDAATLWLDDRTGAVFVVRDHDDKPRRIVTVLTKEHALGNIQAIHHVRGWHGTDDGCAARVEAIRQQAEFERLTELRGLARSHVREYGDARGMQGHSRPLRNEALRQLGYDPCGKDGETYRQFVTEEWRRTYG